MEAISNWHARSVIPELLEPGHYLTRPKVFIAIFTVGSTFAIIFQCIPVQAGYDFTLRPPTG
jgi:RecA-family ATPase